MLEDKDIHSIAHMFQPNRLTLARDHLMITKAELAKRIEKTPSAITQFESGQIKPDTETLLKLSMALGVRPSFFAYESPTGLIEVESCNFRSLRSTRQRERRRILAKATHLGDLVSVLEHYVDLPIEGISELSTEVSSTEDIEELAMEVRRKWRLGLGPIANMVKLLEFQGVIVCPIEEESQKVDAFSFWRSGRPFVLLVINKRSASRSRFDAAHELGHLIMHADAKPGNPKAEKEADRFGSAFLLPKDSFYRECPTRLNWDHFIELKKRWKVSLACIVRRARDLGKISETSYKRAFMQLSELGYRKNEPEEPKTELPQLILQSLGILREEISIDEVGKFSGMNDRMLKDVLEHLGPSPGTQI